MKIVSFIFVTFLICTPSFLWSQNKKISEYFPVPQKSVLEPLPKEGYIVKNICKNVYWVTNTGFNFLFVTTGVGIILMDAPMGFGSKILQAVRSVSEEPIKYVIYSHHHKDHIGAAHLFKKMDVEYVATKRAAELLKKAKDPKRPIPTITYNDTFQIELGEEIVVLDANIYGHSRGDSAIYLPKKKLLMVVDIVFPGWVPFKNFAYTTNVGGYIDAHDKILSYSFDYFVGGHTKLGMREDVILAKEYLLDLKKICQREMQNFDYREAGSDVVKNGGAKNRWLLVQTVFDKLATKCVLAMQKKWHKRLAGTDVFTFSHCWSMIYYLRLE
ncbi:MBL fold metallo-hydrolase [Candidatus Uabimicrobium sp. HlEnr_7]|uniref:MBL fold metallo-hydrolase n=1 Tax=Candidatus Uabimicrobium helgolandensis TaxID=3095367 RepID=UPI0035574CE5